MALWNSLWFSRAELSVPQGFIPMLLCVFFHERLLKNKNTKKGKQKCQVNMHIKGKYKILVIFYILLGTTNGGVQSCGRIWFLIDVNSNIWIFSIESQLGALGKGQLFVF